MPLSGTPKKIVKRIDERNGNLTQKAILLVRPVFLAIFSILNGETLNKVVLSLNFNNLLVAFIVSLL